MQKAPCKQIKRPYISIIVPFFNEEECLEQVCKEVISMAKASGHSWELIMVNDGSWDNTPSLMENISRSHPLCRAIHLNSNSGQSAALEAGFSRAGGEIIATLDGDGQNDPGDIPGLVAEMKRRDVDMLCGIRVTREDNIIRKFSSRMANYVRSRILNDHISDVGCSIRVFRRHCLPRIRFFRNAHRFFPALMIMAGFRVAEIPVRHRPRLRGTSKYGRGINTRLWVGLADLAGVWWLQKRALNYQLSERNEADAS